MGLIMLNLDKIQLRHNLPSGKTTGKSVTFLRNAQRFTWAEYVMRVGNIESCLGGYKFVRFLMILNGVQFVKGFGAIQCIFLSADNTQSTLVK